MGREVRRLNRKEQQPLDPDTSMALRELAGWPLHAVQHNVERERHRSMTIQRDHLGRVVGSVEQVDEHEHESYSEGWGK